MGNIRDDLDKFLKTDGIRIVMDAGGIRIGPCEPLTADDINNFKSMDLEELDETGLEDLLDKTEELRYDLEDEEPEDEQSKKHGLLEDNISETEDFIGRIQDRLDELEAKAEAQPLP